MRSASLRVLSCCTVLNLVILLISAGLIHTNSAHQVTVSRSGYNDNSNNKNCSGKSNSKGKGSMSYCHDYSFPAPPPPPLLRRLLLLYWWQTQAGVPWQSTVCRPAAVARHSRHPRAADLWRHACLGLIDFWADDLGHVKP